MESDAAQRGEESLGDDGMGTITAPPRDEQAGEGGVRERGSTEGFPDAGPFARRDRFEGLEGYRGIAALLVVVFHAYQYSREGTGTERFVYEGTWLHTLFFNLDATVAWFFVLSGFLIFLPFARAAIDRGRPQTARGFLIRRAIRIVPLYYVAILVVWTYRYTGTRGNWLDLVEHLTFTQIFDRRRIFYTIGPAWSLSVEVLFYLLLAALGPLMHAACGRLAGRGARIALLLGATAPLIAASLLYKWWASSVAHIPETDFPAYFGPLAKLDTFVLGMLLAVAVVALSDRPALPAVSLLGMRLAGAAVIAAAFIYRLSSTPVRVYFHTLSGAAFFLILASTTLGPPRARWNRALGHPVFAYLGLTSYSLYLWHEPILIELGKRHVLIRPVPAAFPINALILCLVSLAVASIIYYAVEQPALNLRHLFTREGRLADYYPAVRRRELDVRPPT